MSLSDNRTIAGPHLPNSVVFVNWRLHNNQIGWIQSLRRAGVEVRMWVCFQDVSEDTHDVTKVIQPTESSAQKIASAIQGGQDPEQAYETMFVPSFSWLVRAIRSSKPELVISRELRVLFPKVVLACLLSNIRAPLLYNQEPLRDSALATKSGLSTSRAVLRRIFGTVTPVLQREPLKSSDWRSVLDFAPSKSYLLPFVVEPRPMLERVEQDGGATDIRICSVGKYRLSKRHESLIRIFQKVHTATPWKLRLEIFGRCVSYLEVSEYQRLQQLVNDLGLSNAVQLRTNVSRETLLHSMERAELFVLVSDNELASYSVLEAMGAGLPVVVPVSNGTNWVVEDGVSGWSMSGEDEDLAAERLREILADRDKLRQYGRRAHQAVAEKSSERLFLKALSEIYTARGDISSHKSRGFRSP